MAAREIFRLVGKIALDGSVQLDERLKAIDKSAAKTGASLNKMGKDLTKIGMGLTKGITLPLLAVVGAVTKFGADFDKAMTESTAIISDLSDEMRGKMADAAREVATTTRFSATEAAQAYFYLASAGLSAAQSIAVLPKVAAFAQAGAFDMEQATSLLADAQSALGLKVADATENMKNMVRVSDVLVKANVLANANVQQFSESLTNKAGAAMKMVNMEIEEGVAVLAAYADQGIKAEEAGTQFSMLLRDLQKAAIKNKQAFKDAGIAVYDSSGNMRNMADIIFDLENRLSGMSDEQKRAEITALGFKDKSIMAMLALLGTSDAIRAYEEKLRAAGGTTDEVAQKQIRNFWDMLNLLKDKLIDVALTIWENTQPTMVNVVIPALEKIASVLKIVANWFGNLSPPMQKTIMMFALLAASFGPFLTLAGKFSSLLGVLIPLFGKVITGQLTLNAAMAANPVLAVVSAITVLIAAFTLLYNNNEKFRTSVQQTWKAVKEYIIETIETLKPILVPLYEHFKARFLNMWNIVKIVFSQIMNYITTMLNVLKNLFATFTAILRGDWQAAWERLGNIVDTVVKYVLGTWSNFKLYFLQNLKGIVDGIYAFVKNVPKVGAVVKKISESLDNLIKDENTAKLKRHGLQLEDNTKSTDELTISTDKLKTAKDNLGDAENDLTTKLTDGANALEDEAKATLDQIQAAKELAEKRAEFEREWSDRLLQETGTREEILEAEYQTAIAKAKELGADTADIEAYYAQKRIDLAKEVADKKADYEEVWSTKLLQETGTRLEILEAEYQAEIEKANELGADITDIEAYYAQKRIEIYEQEAEEAKEIQRQKFQVWADFASSMLQKLGNVLAMFSANRMAELDNYYEKEKEEIERSTLSQEEKEKRLAELDADVSKRKKEEARKQAQREKTFAIFQTIIDTATAIVKTLASTFWPLNVIMAGVVGALGAAQVAAISSQPLPALAGGGLAVGPVQALIGEGNEDELILPMQTGVEALADGLLSRLGGQQALAAAGGYGTANLYLELDGRVIARKLGVRLTDEIRTKAGVRQ